MTQHLNGEGRSEKIGQYEILSEISRSPTGRVFLGQDPGSKALVAIKEMLLEQESGVSPEEQVARFQREAEIHHALSHPNIVPALDWGSEGDRHYLVMEYQAGHSWHSLLEDENERKGLTLPRILELGAQLCKALFYMHEHGVVHRDIKPANLLISPIGELKVTDFGMARRSFGPGITQAKMMLGTLNYMSPEQLLDATAVDGRSDVFAAGVILYKTFTGQLPFAAQTATDVAHNLLYADPPHPKNHNALLPDSLADKLLKCLHKDPDYRYLSAESLGRDLEDELANPELYVCQGKRYQLAGSHGEATHAFQTAINLDGNHADAWFGLGESYEQLGQEEQAMECYLRVVAVDAARVAAYQRLGKSYARTGNAQAALKMLQRAWVLAPRDRETCFLLASTYMELGQTAEAIEQFELLTAEYPDWAEAFFELGRLYYQQGHPERALAAFAKAASLLPTNADMLFNLASLHQELGQLEPARANYEALIQQVPDHAHAGHNLACCLYALGATKEAEAHLRRVLEQEPTWSQSWFVLGHLCEANGRGQAGLEAFEQAVAFDPANMDACLTLGQSYYRHYRPNAALEVFTHAANTAGPHQATAFFFLAQTYRVKGAVAEAIEALEACLTLNPDREMAQGAEDLLRALGARKASTFQFPGGLSDRMAR